MKKILLLLVTLVGLGFAAQAQLFTLSSPNGGQSLQGCNTLTVTYTKLAGASALQKIDISINAGRTYFEIGTFNSTGLTNCSVNLPLPNLPTTKARVRVREAGTTTGSDASDANFTITTAVMAPPLSISSPAVLQTYPVASTQRIAWNGTPDRTYVVGYSIISPFVFTPIATVTGRTFLDWNIPFQSSRIYIQVQDQADPCRMAFSDTLFRSSTATPALGLRVFNGGEVVQTGESYDITWNNSNVPQDTVTLELSTNNGATWQLLSDSLPKTGVYSWTVPSVTTTQALFRVRAKGNTAISDVSNSTFSIVAPGITLTNQTVAGPLAGCQSYSVDWAAQGTSGFYKILLSTNNGLTWYPLTGQLALGAGGTFSQVVSIPSVTTNQAKIAVVDAFVPSSRDTTNGVFSIVAGATNLNITNPLGGQTLPEGASINITWNTVGSVPTVDVLLSQNGGLTFATLATGIANTGSRSWTVPVGQTGATYVLRVQSSTDACISNQTDAFSVSNAGVVGILFPVGGEQFVNGQTQNIRWEATGLGGSNQVEISFSADGGSTYTPVATVANTGSYAWTVPSIGTNGGLIRVADASNGGVAASSPGSFQIIINMAPSANAGNDIFINLPSTAVTINGLGSDPEGSAITYLWSVVSGPNVPILANATSRVLSASSLVLGSYVFRLTVRDNFNLMGSDEVRVVVNPALPATPTAWNWVRSATSMGNDRGNKVVSDAQGNAYVVGGFSAPASFAGGADVPNAGAMDAFVAKFDSTGVMQWIRTLGNTQDDEAMGITFLPNGDVAITGWYNLSVSIPGTTVSARGSQDVFIASLTQNGDWQWLRTAGGGGVDQGQALSVAGGELYVSGFLGGTGFFGALPAANQGDRDAFVAKYTVSGAPVWVRTLGSATRDASWGVSAGQLGIASGVVMTGFVSGSVTIGGTTFPTLGGDDAFTAAYLADGSFVGFRRFGGTANDAGNQVLIGPDPLLGTLNPRVIVAGTFRNTMALPGGPTLTSLGDGDAFVVAFDLGGNTPFAMRMGATGDDGANDIALTADRLWVTGYISNRQTNGPRAFGAMDAFVSRHTLDGTQLQLLQAGSQSVDFGRGIATSVNGSIYNTGRYRLTARFGPNEIGGRGNEEFYVGRITNNPMTNFREATPELLWTTAHKAVVMPNPAVANSMVRLDVAGFDVTTTQATLTVLDMSGRTLATQAVQVVDGVVAHELQAPQEAGVYLIRLTGDGVAPLTRRLTVQ